MLVLLYGCPVWHIIFQASYLPNCLQPCEVDSHYSWLLSASSPVFLWQCPGSVLGSPSLPWNTQIYSCTDNNHRQPCSSVALKHIMQPVRGGFKVWAQLFKRKMIVHPMKCKQTNKKETRLTFMKAALKVCAADKLTFSNCKLQCTNTQIYKPEAQRTTYTA